MLNPALDTFLSLAGLGLVFIFLSEDFQEWLARLKAFLTSRPRWKFLVYPLGAVLALGAAALILQTLMTFAGLRFSYD